MMNIDIIDLPSVSLSNGNPTRRDPPPTVIVLKDTFWDGYDSRTLVYQAVASRPGRLRLFCPPLYNLAPELTSALGGAGVLEPGRYVIRHHRQMDIIEAKTAHAGPGEVAFRVLGEDHILRIEAPDTTRFQGKNVLYTQSKNNQLNWIADWMRYHAETHGANALVFVDNASTAYSTERLRDTIASVGGYDTALIIRSPLPYQPPTDSKAGQPPCVFFQVGLANALRDRWMKHARAVLAIDIDEMLAPSAAETVFDAAAKSPLGAVRLIGTMIYPTSDGKADHADHKLRRVSVGKSHGKYCYRPQSYMGRGNLGAHSIHSGIRNPLNRHLLRSRVHYYLHYFGVSTSWKFSRLSNPDVEMVPDETAHEIARILGG